MDYFIPYDRNWPVIKKKIEKYLLKNKDTITLKDIEYLFRKEDWYTSDKRVLMAYNTLKRNPDNLGIALGTIKWESISNKYFEKLYDEIKSKDNVEPLIEFIDEYDNTEEDNIIYKVSYIINLSMLLKRHFKKLIKNNEGLTHSRLKKFLKQKKNMDYIRETYFKEESRTSIEGLNEKSFFIIKGILPSKYKGLHFGFNWYYPTQRLAEMLCNDTTKVKDDIIYAIDEITGDVLNFQIRLVEQNGVQYIEHILYSQTIYRFPDKVLKNLKIGTIKKPEKIAYIQVVSKPKQFRDRMIDNSSLVNSITKDELQLILENVVDQSYINTLVQKITDLYSSEVTIADYLDKLTLFITPLISLTNNKKIQAQVSSYLKHMEDPEVLINTMLSMDNLTNKEINILKNIQTQELLRLNQLYRTIKNPSTFILNITPLPVKYREILCEDYHILIEVESGLKCVNPIDLDNRFDQGDYIDPDTKQRFSDTNIKYIKDMAETFESELFGIEEKIKISPKMTLFDAVMKQLDELESITCNTCEKPITGISEKTVDIKTNRILQFCNIHCMDKQ